MPQNFKTIYFSDLGHKDSNKNGISIPFGKDEEPLYNAVSHLSSFSVRKLIGHDTYKSLSDAAEFAALPIARYCRDLIKTKIGNGRTKQSNNKFSDSLQATFAGGKGYPLHSWYPYLEGYSPDFVKEILRHYAPKAKSVFDPFAGLGTTPLTGACENIQTFYCEINPLCEFISKAKLKAVTLPDNKRQSTSEELRELSISLQKMITKAQVDHDLESNYYSVFKDSKFFDPEVFDTVLKTRTLIDKISRKNNNLGLFLETAVLRSLIPSSRLIRRGDLRFKTANEAKKFHFDFIETVSEAIDIIASDISDLTHIDAKAEFLCADAKEAYRSFPKKVDAIITSPPYLNGTNYFRNTKIELWFLRKLSTPKDLREFRYRSVTAGINDVTKKKTQERAQLYENRKLERVVKQLKKTAYDKRIPDMIGSYFGDLFLTFKNLFPALKPGATIAIDIGDSQYGSVHVPTDDILSDMLQEFGCVVVDKIVLRERMSRGGVPLRQVLQIFELSRPSIRKKTRNRSENTKWLTNWKRFKKDLPHQRGEMAKRNWGSPLHSLCSYQGKLKPSIAFSLVKTFTPPGGAVLDPFAGVGTIPFEAALNGRDAFAFEISIPAFQITKAKLSKFLSDDSHDAIKELEKYISSFKIKPAHLKRASKIKFNGQLEDYFNTTTFKEILATREYFLKNTPSTPSESLVFSCLLHILHGNRPYALSRRSHPITPFAPTGPTEYRPLIPRLMDKVNRSLACDRGDSFKSGTVYFHDSTKPWPSEVSNLDAIITSPPFFDSTRFYSANWMRLWFSGWEAEDFNYKPLDFVDTRQKTSFDVYLPIFKQARERLKGSGVMVLHLGKSRKCDMAENIRRVANEWFTVKDEFSENVQHCESHGIRDKGTVTSHQYMVLIPN